MKQYEMVVLLHPDLEMDVDAPIAKIEKLITNGGGSITKRDNWGKKRLAYPVKKQSFGVYVYFELDLDPQSVRSLESSLLITEEVIRFLLVHRLPEQAKSPDKSDKREDKPAAATAASKEE
jgi:small subunit ribosomal protein S6